MIVTSTRPDPESPVHLRQESQRSTIRTFGYLRLYLFSRPPLGSKSAPGVTPVPLGRTPSVPPVPNLMPPTHAEVSTGDCRGFLVVGGRLIVRSPALGFPSPL